MGIDLLYEKCTNILTLQNEIKLRWRILCRHKVESQLHKEYFNLIKTMACSKS